MGEGISAALYISAPQHASIQNTHTKNTIMQWQFTCFTHKENKTQTTSYQQSLANILILRTLLKNWNMWETPTAYPCLLYVYSVNPRNLSSWTSSLPDFYNKTTKQIFISYLYCTQTRMQQGHRRVNYLMVNLLATEKFWQQQEQQQLYCHFSG